MKSLNPKFIDSLNFTSSHLADLRKLGEFRGKQDLFNKKSAEALKILKKHAIIESIESSNRIEQITAPYQRIKGLVNKTTSPKNRSEKEIAGYRDALNLIHESYEHMVVSINVIKQLHTIIYRHLPEDGGHFKSANNTIVENLGSSVVRERFKPVSVHQTPQAMENLCANYIDFLGNHSIDSLILCPLLILDFLCIHPFKDGNGRLSRLLTLLVLHHHGYEVGKYISLERIFEESKDSYYKTLHESSQGWHSATHNPFPWMEYFWGVIIKAYKEFEENIINIKETTGGKGLKTEQIKFIIKKKIGPFSISDIEKDCPEISRDMIRHVLRQLRDEGKIHSQGIGRNAKWQMNSSINITVTSQRKNLEGINVLLLFSNNTYKQAITDKNGETSIYLHSTKEPITIFVASENHSAYLKKDWIPLTNILIELQTLPNGGSVIFPNETGYIPGLKGRLTSILDTSNRTYLYARNIAVKGGKQQPVDFNLREKFHLQDSNGIEKNISIIEIKGQSSLVEYYDI